MQRVTFYLYVQASKKQLVKGKVAMVFAVIETLDTQGSDASVTLRDKSGILSQLVSDISDLNFLSETNNVTQKGFSIYEYFTF